jgi:pyruvate formate-lyase/glycerol dehydratase family glycyl radical enzyme
MVLEASPNMKNDNKISTPGSVSFEDRATKTVPFEWGFGSTPRVGRLREALKWKAAVTKEWLDVALGMGKCTYRHGQHIKMDLDRARLITRSYKETEGQPWTVRRAKAVQKLCEEMPIFIKPDELIVGDPNSAPDEIRWYPEISVWWMPDAVTSGGFSEMVTDAERQEIVEDICQYWKGRCVRDRIAASLPEVWQPLLSETGVGNRSANFAVWEEGRTFSLYDYESLYKEGLRARIDRAEVKLKELESKIAQMDPAEYLEQKNNWEAMATCGRAILRYAERHAELAREQARAERDEARKRELEEMAAVLDWVPANPPRTFHEALQFFWVIEVVGHFLTVCGNGCGVRIDQVWWPYYEADVRADRINREKALELVECLFLKIQDLGSPPEWPVVFTATSGFDVTFSANICGSDAHGRDASNDLSCIIMEALANCHLTQPPIVLRYHRNISPRVIDRAIDLLRTGQGHPSFYNEDLLEKFAFVRGYSCEDAGKTVVGACVANRIVGRFIGGTGLAEVAGVFVIKLLEEALGLIEGPAVPGRPRVKDLKQVQSADDLLDGCCDRLLFYTAVGVNSWNLGQQVIMEYNPDPCNSFLADEPLDRGIDLTRLHTEHDTVPKMILFGAVNLCDSLAAIQKLVFDDGKYTMEELVGALKANWEGYETMRQDFLHAPKYGNDDDFADEWAVKVMTRLHDTVSQVKDAWGCPVTFDGSTAAAYQMAGLPCAASPDGRLAGGHLADGSVSPMAGADRYGPTAALNSVGKIPYMHPQLLNQRFLPVFLEGENKKLFAGFLREWYEKGTIPHIQFNVVDSEVLREAQENPERYADLQVRVAGYSAFWVDLPRETQDSIIARTEQSLT